MRHTEALWNSVHTIYRAILSHPFVSGLTSGGLSRESFEFYVVQDALYLREFARALSIAGAKAPVEEWIITFNRHSAGALEVERALHESFFKEFGLTEEAVRATEMAPTNRAYTSYLLSVAYGSPFHELLGAVLPCYWIYLEVGKELAEKGSRNPLYKRWIDTYAAEAFGEVVRAVLEITENVLTDLTEEQRRMARHHFMTTSRYEWMFWDMGYRMEKWPV